MASRLRIPGALQALQLRSPARPGGPGGPAHVAATLRRGPAPSASAAGRGASSPRRPFSTRPPLRQQLNNSNGPRPGSGPSPSSSSGSGSGSGHHSGGDGGGGSGGGGGGGEPSLGYKMLESAATSFASVLVLAVGFATAAYAYHRLYKVLQLQKMANAFEPGDPVLDLAAMGKGIHTNRHGRRVHDDNVGKGHGGDGGDDEDEDHWVQRPEQAKVDAIVAGRDKGHYHLLIGEKGTGKSSMLIEAMRKIDGEGVAMFEAHSDLEIFRIRLGKALDYEFHEDYIGGYFSEKGPRDTTALLDIERALNKLEKVALRRRAKVGRPLIMIINQLHLVRDDEDGRDLIELLQQRAEQWAAANLVTMVLNSDDYWVYERLKLLATRMEVTSVSDLPKASATAALKRYRARYFREILSDDLATKVYDRVGGRLSFLNRVAKSHDMLKTCDEIKEVEKTYFLNQCWILGEEMDDDVMDQQKWAAAAMVLAQALVDLEASAESTDDAEDPSTPDTAAGSTTTKALQTYDPVAGHRLPSVPMHIAQQLQTRADFVRELDRMNLFTITSTALMRASSVPMHRAFREICRQPGFRDHLAKTQDRIDAIESLGRTRELVAKDLVLGGTYEIGREPDAGGRHGGGGKVVVTLRQPPEDDDGDDTAA